MFLLNLFANRNTVQEAALLKKIESIEEDAELYNTLYAEIKTVELAKSALLALQSQKKLHLLTHHPFYSYDIDKFKIPDANGKPQSEGSAFAFLCKNNLNVGIYVLTDKDFYELLHEDDLWMIAESRQGDEIKAVIKADKTLMQTVRPDFIQYLDIKATVFEP